MHTSKVRGTVLTIAASVAMEASAQTSVPKAPAQAAPQQGLYEIMPDFRYLDNRGSMTLSFDAKSIRRNGDLGTVHVLRENTDAPGVTHSFDIELNCSAKTARVRQTTVRSADGTETKAGTAAPSPIVAGSPYALLLPEVCGGS